MEEKVTVNKLKLTIMTRFAIKVSENFLSRGFWPWVGRVT